MKFLRKVFPREILPEIRRNIFKSGYVRYTGYSFEHNLSGVDRFNQYGDLGYVDGTLSYDSTNLRATGQITIPALSEEYFFTITHISVTAGWVNAVDVVLEINIIRRDTLEILDVIRQSYTSTTRVEFYIMYYDVTKKIFRIPANVEVQVIVTLTFSASVGWNAGNFIVDQVKTPTRFINFDPYSNNYFIETRVQWKISQRPMLLIDDEIRDYLTPDKTIFDVYVEFSAYGVFEYALLIDARTNNVIARATAYYDDYKESYRVDFSLKNIFNADFILRLYSSQSPLYAWIESVNFSRMMVISNPFYIPQVRGNRVVVKTKSIGTVIICSDTDVYIGQIAGSPDCLLRDFWWDARFNKAYCDALPNTSMYLLIPEVIEVVIDGKSYTLLDPKPYNVRISFIERELTDEDKKALACYLQ